MRRHDFLPNLYPPIRMMIRSLAILIVLILSSHAFGQRVTTKADDGVNGVAGADSDPGQAGGDGSIGMSISEIISAVGELYRGLAAGNGGAGGTGGGGP